MIIPVNRLPRDTLLLVIEEFISREGTDYGAREYGLQEKVDQVLAQLEAGHIVIAYDEASESVNLVPKRDYEVSMACSSMISAESAGRSDSDEATQA